MPSHKTKAVQIDAILASAIIASFDKPNKLPKWVRDQIKHYQIKLVGGVLLICTANGLADVAPTDYVIQVATGELSSMSAADFAQKYEAV